MSCDTKKIQSELALARKPQQVAVPIEMIRAKRTKGSAFTLACDASGLEDKEIAGAMIPPIDPGTFSRLKSGQNSLDADRVGEFCDVVGNQVYPEWLAFQVGCTLVMIQSEAERRAMDAESRAAEAEKKLNWALEVLNGRSS